MDVTEDDVLEAVLGNLQLLASEQQFLDYLERIPSPKPYEEWMVFWRSSIYLEHDEVFESLFAGKPRELLENLNRKLLGAAPFFATASGVEDFLQFFKTDSWQNMLALLSEAIEAVSALRTLSSVPPVKKSSTKNSPPPPYLDFEKAREFVLTLKLKTRKDWRRYCEGELPDRSRKPAFIPPDPEVVYEGLGWRGWTHFFGSNASQNFFKSKKNIQKLGKN